LRNAGLDVREQAQNKGWQRRARSSGGFPSVPLAVFWHHTASSTTPTNDLAWQCHNCPDKPVGNMLIDRQGIVWPVAAGASNCAGQGGPARFSRGTIPANMGNTRGWQIECANSGVGGPTGVWPQVQVDALFTASNALNRLFGNRPDDVITHALGTGDGWTNRKIDPARSSSVQGPWRPRGCNGSADTWVLADIRAECNRRAGARPMPPTPEEDDVTDEDIERIAQRAAQLVWQYPLADYVAREGGDASATQWSGGLLPGAHYEAYKAHHGDKAS
jgi:hypothetical protein